MPPVVHEAIGSPGQALEAGTRSFMDSRFQHDFSRVRVHTDARAAESALAVDALAYTIGSDVVFGAGRYAPRTRAGRELIAHELAHVAQAHPASSGGKDGPLEVAEPGCAAEQEADAAASKVAAGESVDVSAMTAPRLYRKKQAKEKVRDGELSIDMEPQGQVGKGFQEQVFITFEPDTGGPKTQDITFTQIAKLDFADPQLSFAKMKPDEAMREQMQTTAADRRTHVTARGDTLASLSRIYYGTPDFALRIFAANNQVLNVPAKARRPLGRKGMEAPGPFSEPWEQEPEPDADYGLQAGLTLTIPIEQGFAADIELTTKRGAKNVPIPARSSPKDPNVPVDYPNVIRKGKNPPGGYSGRASMEDYPGGAYASILYEFETAVRADDLGIYYGAVQWGFDYSPRAITGEWLTITPYVSAKLGAAVAQANKYYKNQHVVLQGETLNILSEMYFGSRAKAPDIYKANQSQLTTSNPDAPITPGIRLEIPGVSA